MATGSTQRQSEVLAARHAQGHTKVLAVGVDDYDRDAGFAPLRTARNDATGFLNCFRDISALRADPDALTGLVSGGTVAPSRGEIIRALRKLARSAAVDDRLVVFFRGHAHRIPGDPELYLVPQDAFAADDPGCLVGFSAILTILEDSAAEQKLVILGIDAGQVVLDKPTGVTILACPADEAAAPNPQHSLLGAQLLPALQGSIPVALDHHLLTVASLHAYLTTTLRPVMHAGAGVMLLADFSGPILGADAFDLDGKLFRRISLTSRGGAVAIKHILTSLTRTTYTQEYLETQANRALGPYLAKTLGEQVSTLRARFRWASSEVSVEDGCISFPDGHCQSRYRATAKLHGVLVEDLSLAPSWLAAPGMLADLLTCLGHDPAEVSFTLARELVPTTCVPRLEAHGWQITSELRHKIEACSGPCALKLTADTLTLSGLPLVALFAAQPDRDVVRTAAAALAILGG